MTSDLKLAGIITPRFTQTLILILNTIFSNNDFQDKENVHNSHDPHLISVALLLLVEVVASVSVLNSISVPEFYSSSVPAYVPFSKRTIIENLTYPPSVTKNLGNLSVLSPLCVPIYTNLDCLH